MASSARTKTKQTFLQCPCCNTVTPIHRKKRLSKQKAKGHIKDLWCWVCKREQKFVEVKESVFIPGWIEEFQSQFYTDEEREVN